MSIQARIQLEFFTAAVAAGTDEIFPLIIARPGVWRLEKAYFVAGTAVTANATNYTDLSIKIGANEVASEATTVADTGNIAASAAEELVLTGTGTALEATGQSTVITVLKTDAGTGVAIDGSFCLSFVQVNA